ncbi:MAG: CDP-diacylglycerol--serine O-phosphatidyltransferase [Terrimonas sp.]|nr:CDP-diacylglycerol--serine O-phosphatidyltransferase [Terrimonas sp.]
MKQIPNLFTLLNLFFGCMAIVFVLQNGIEIIPDANGQQLLVIPEKIWMASLFIGLAALVDFLDGFVARLFKAVSPMGKQLDSLADVVSFGVAPAMIIYQFLRLSIAQEEDGLETSILWMAPAFFIACAAAWRLAKFNIDTRQEEQFRGIPTPAAGLLVACFPLIYWNVQQQWVTEILLNKWFLYFFIAFISLLMVSNIPIMSFKFRDFGIKNNLYRYLLILLGIIAVLFIKWLAAPVIFIAYLLVSLLTKNRHT